MLRFKCYVCKDIVVKEKMSKINKVPTAEEVELVDCRKCFCCSFHYKKSCEEDAELEYEKKVDITSDEDDSEVEKAEEERAKQQQRDWEKKLREEEAARDRARSYLDGEQDPLDWLEPCSEEDFELVLSNDLSELSLFPSKD